MKIQQKNGKILISSNGSKVEIGEGIEIINKDAVSLIINNPGEYEFSGVMVQALPRQDSKEILFFSLDIEGLNVVYFNADFDLPTKKQVEQIGLNNIMIINCKDAGIDKTRDMIDLFEPEVLLPLIPNQLDLESLAKKLGLVLPEKQAVYSVTAEDFEVLEEDMTLQLFILE